MTLLILGGCGYVGSVLVKKLLTQGHTVIVLDTMWFGNPLPSHPNLSVHQADIRDEHDYPMKGVDRIIHLANIANDPCGDLDAKLLWEVNVLATMRLIEAAIKHEVKQFIFASSGSVYGIKEEKDVIETLSLVPISNYNKTKMISERVLLSYQDQINIQCIRPATVCGFSPRTRLDVSVNMLTMQALTNKKITVFGGQQVRPNIHIQDLTDAFIHAFAFEKSGGIYNAGFENISIVHIAEKIAARIPAKIEITQSNDPRSYRLNSDRLLKTGFKPKYGIEFAITELIDAYKDARLTDTENGYNIKKMNQLLIK